MNVIMKRTKQKGRGVFAARSLTSGDVVVRGRFLKALASRTHHSFEVGFDEHIELDEPARVINHSCDPNTGIQNNQFGGYNFIALRPIQVGEEITWDYETSEYTSIAVKRCFCGSAKCRKHIVGFQFREEELRTKYGEYLAGYLTQKVHRVK